MNNNPFIYDRALEANETVCLPREIEVGRVTQSLGQGEYWTVLGAARTGKTTFLNLMKNSLANSAVCIYIDLKEVPVDENNFYNFLIEEITKNVPPEEPAPQTDLSGDTAYQFQHFLENFIPETPVKIVFLFDNIEYLTFKKDFLQAWRAIHSARSQAERLKNISIIIASSMDLLKLTIEDNPNSPYNVANNLYLPDFTEDERETLINSFLSMNISIKPKAKKYLFSMTAGHPQLLQHTCHILVQVAQGSASPITKDDIKNAIEILFTQSPLMQTLADELKSNKQLLDLVAAVIKGKKIKFLRFKEFSISGAGAMVEQGGYCAIRNKVFEEYIKRNIL